MNSVFHSHVGTNPDRTAAGICLPIVACMLGACGGNSLPIEKGMGTNPFLPEPDKQLIPTVNIAPAVHWPDRQATATAMQ